MYGRLKDYVIHSDSENENEEPKVEKVIKESKQKEDEYEYDRDTFINQKRIRDEEKNPQADDQEVYIKEVEVDYCGLCNKRVNNQREFNSHVKSKSHLKKLKSQILTDLKEAGTIKNYLLLNNHITTAKGNLNTIRRLLYTMTLNSIITNY